MAMQSSVTRRLILCGTIMCLMSAKTQSTTIEVNQDHIVHRVSSEFVSFTLDSSIFEPPTHQLLNFSSPRLHTLLRGMAPAIFRVGGSPADWLVFNRPPRALNASGVLPTPVVMSKADWDNLVRVTSQADLRLLFDLDLQLRFGTQWDPSNAIELFEYSVQRGYGANIDWELGNEPNMYVKPGQTAISGPQLGRDFMSLVGTIRSYKAFNGSRVVGPDIVGASTGSADIIEGYLNIAGSVVNALTIHHYYFRGDTAHWPDYIDPRHFDSLPNNLETIEKLVQKSKFPTTPVWIGETSDAWHGGTEGVSDRFISAFLWLDKLGVSAQRGVEVVMRQTFWGHNYPLTSTDFFPNPDYWLSLLHKRLVGTKVLGVVSNERPLTTRVYAHCASQRFYKPGSVVIFALNVNRTNTDILTFSDPTLRSQILELYLAQPGDDEGLLSKYVKVNGIQMKMTDDETLPDFYPIQWDASRGVALPPTTYTFLVFPNANFTICK